MLIVVVDDRQTNRRILSELAQSLDPRVTVASFADPCEALRKLPELSPFLIITDFVMPGMDGAEFIRQCRKLLLDPDIPIIVITAYEDRKLRYEALEAGATDFLLSPIDHREFRTRASNLLTMRRQQSIIRDRAIYLQHELTQAVRGKEQALRASEERLRNVINAVPAVIRAVDAAGHLVFANRYHDEVLGADGPDTNDLAAAATYRFRHASLDQRIFETGQEERPFEEEIADVDGTLRSFLTTKIALSSEQERPQYVVTVSIDITERKQYEQRLFHQANFDPVTGLPNRNLALDRLDTAIARGERARTRVALLYIDLDGFKQVNDTVGHAAGDRLLAEMGQRLRESLRAADTVARLGGDEFLVILPDTEDDVTTEVVAAKMIEQVSAPVHAGSYEFVLSASIGVCFFPEDGTRSDELLRHADAAMYRAKFQGRNRFCFFTPDIGEQVVERVKLEGLLRHALVRQELALHFQPLVDLESHRIVGVEALLRWHSPELGLVGPDSFIPIAEESGLIVSLGEWVLRTACHQAKRWRDQFGVPLRLAINVSSRQLAHGDLAGLVADILAETGLPADELELEITERLLLQDAPENRRTLGRLRDMGVRLSLDDFGTGYASIIYLKRFPFSTLKIDRLFVSDAAKDPESAALVCAIIAMAKSLNLETIGEGVEEEAQRHFLSSQGCTLFQGFLHSRPLPAPALEAWLERHFGSPFLAGLAGARPRLA